MPHTPQGEASNVKDKIMKRPVSSLIGNLLSDNNNHQEEDNQEECSTNNKKVKFVSGGGSAVVSGVGGGGGGFNNNLLEGMMEKNSEYNGISAGGSDICGLDNEESVDRVDSAGGCGGSSAEVSYHH